MAAAWVGVRKGRGMEWTTNIRWVTVLANSYSWCQACRRYGTGWRRFLGWLGEPVLHQAGHVLQGPARSQFWDDNEVFWRALLEHELRRRRKEARKEKP